MPSTPIHTRPGGAHPHRPAAAYVCQVCHQPQGDPLYRGPAGHCPPDVDFDCWVNYWEDRPEADWSRMTLVMWLLSVGGFTQAEAGTIAGVSVRKVGRWLRYLRENPEKILEIVSDFGGRHVRQTQKH